VKRHSLGAVLLLFCVGCSSSLSNQLTPHQTDEIKNQVKLAADTLVAKLEKLDADGSLQFYADSPEWVMFNADGSRSDYQTARKAVLDLVNSSTAYKWTTMHQDFMVFSKDIVICAWNGRTRPN
jgi:hypothetical protein